MVRNPYPEERLERAVPVGNGIAGSHEIGALWAPTDDPEILKDRLRRRDEQVRKLKEDRAELKVAIKLKTEEAYNEGLLAMAPKLLEIDSAVTELAQKILKRSAEGIADEDLKALKVLLQETTKQRDRLYGKTRQRVTSTSLSASVDINRLQEQSRGVLAAGVEPETVDEIDVDVVDEEMIDE